LLLFPIDPVADADLHRQKVAVLTRASALAAH